MNLQRIKELRAEIMAECISYGELAEIYAAAEDAGIESTDEMLADDLLDLLEEDIYTSGHCDGDVVEGVCNQCGTNFNELEKIGKANAQ